MTLIIDNPAAASANGKGSGRVVRVIGPVVDVEFAPDQMPEVNNALELTRTIGDDSRTITLEVAQHIGDNTVRAISMQATDGVVRGTEVTDTGAPISVPVGDVTKGLGGNRGGPPPPPAPPPPQDGEPRPPPPPPPKFRGAGAK